MTKDISIISISSLLVFIIPVFLICNYIGLKIKGRIIYSIFRMLIQLGFLGFYLKYIFQWDNIFINILYLFIMIVVASFSVIKSTNLNLKKFIIPIFLAIFIPCVLMLFYFNLFALNLENVFEAKYFITIGGMILGNTLKSCIVVLNNFYKKLSENENTYLYLLNLYGTKKKALMGYIRDSIFNSITMHLSSMETIGLVALPGMMTGQVLGGSFPETAVKYQIAIMLIIFSNVFFTNFLILIFSFKNAFNEYGVLNKDIFKEKMKKILNK